MKQSNQKGFTLIEILVITPILMVTVLATITFLFNEFGQITKQNGQLNLQLEAQNILFGLQDDIWYSNQFASDKNANLIDSYAPVGGWVYNTTPPTLIISTAALTKSHRDPNRQPIYLNESTCTPVDGNGVNSVLYNNVIYFVSGTNLYKRTLSAPGGLAVCSNLYSKQTCPTANSSSSCPADILLSDHINTFGITYYDTGNSTTLIPENSESVKIDLGLKDKAYGEDILASSSLRLRKINQ
jgi:type II secretory pathway pseudopilin PulG